MQLGSPVKHLLVDLDGTLLGNRQIPLSVEFVKRALGTLKPYGGIRKAARALNAVRKEFDRPSKDRSPDLTNDNRVVGQFAKRMNVPQEIARKILRDGVGMIFPGLEKHFFPMPGAKEFLDWAKDHYALTLATNPVWPPEIIELRVKWAGVDPAIFKSITHVRRMHACKPAIEYYQEILEQEGREPEDCVLIGDNVRMDLPATKAGIRVFIVGKPKTKGKTVESLEYAAAKAKAWRGSFANLKKALEAQLEA